MVVIPFQCQKYNLRIPPWKFHGLENIKYHFLFYISEAVTPKKQFLSPCMVRCWLRFEKVLSWLCVRVEVDASLYLSAACTRCWWCWTLISAAKFCWEEIGPGCFRVLCPLLCFNNLQQWWRVQENEITTTAISGFFRAVSFVSVCPLEGNLEITFSWSKPEDSVQWLTGNFTPWGNLSQNPEDLSQNPNDSSVLLAAMLTDTNPAEQLLHPAVLLKHWNISKSSVCTGNTFAYQPQQLW